MSKKKVYPPHPLASEYPMMSPHDQGRMEQDMIQRGYDPRFPVVLFQGQILDGRNRSECAGRAGVEPVYVEFKGTEQEAEFFVRRANEERRHLTQEWLQKRRGDRIARVAQLRSEGASLRKIAEEVGVSPTQVTKDLEQASVQGGTVAPVNGTVTGRDGKVRSATRAPRKEDGPDPQTDPDNYVPYAHALGHSIEAIAEATGLINFAVESILANHALEQEVKPDPQTDPVAYCLYADRRGFRLQEIAQAVGRTMVDVQTMIETKCDPRTAPYPSEQEPEEEPAPTKKKKAKVPAPTEDAPVDKEGNVVPPHIRDVFGDTFLPETIAKLKGWYDAIQINPIVNGLRSRLKHLGFLRMEQFVDQIQEAELQLKLAIETAEQAQFYAVHTACGGHGCEKCRHAGYVPQWRWEELRREESR